MSYLAQRNAYAKDLGFTSAGKGNGRVYDQQTRFFAERGVQFPWFKKDKVKKKYPAKSMAQRVAGGKLPLNYFPLKKLPKYGKKLPKALWRNTLAGDRMSARNTLRGDYAMGVANGFIKRRPNATVIHLYDTRGV